MLLPVPDIIFGDWQSVQTAIEQIRFNLSTDASPTLAGLVLSGLTASRLVAVDANKLLVSSDIVNWIAGTANQVIVTDDADGSVTLSTPQNIHTDATPEWAGTVIKDSGGYTIFYVDNDEMYFTAAPTDPVTGNPMGAWLFWFTYTM